MYDIGIFLSFVAIVLSPCLVALRSRIRSERAEAKLRVHASQPVVRRDRSRQRAQAPCRVPSAPRYERVKQSARSCRAKSTVPARAATRQATSTAIFIAPVRFGAGRPAGRGRKAAAGVPVARYTKMAGICIRPVRREVVSASAWAQAAVAYA